MPITEDEWETGVRGTPWLEAIFRFLDEGHPKAYTSAEICSNLLDIPDDDPVEDSIFLLFIVGQLETLVEKGTVETRVIDSEESGEETYYRKDSSTNSKSSRRDN